jgi:hypothetical protein
MADKCKVIGSFGKHKLPKGYYDDVPYLKKGISQVDGVGTVHLDLTAECERCGKSYTVARIHLPPGSIEWLKGIGVK